MIYEIQQHSVAEITWVCTKSIFWLFPIQKQPYEIQSQASENEYEIFILAHFYSNLDLFQWRRLACYLFYLDALNGLKR